MAQAQAVAIAEGRRSPHGWPASSETFAGGAGTAADGFGKDWLPSDRAARDPFGVDVYGTDPWGQETERDWQELALCSQTDPEAFFPEKGGSTREAKKICTGCEVRAECLEYALAHDERFGIWGGLSERERRKLRKRAV
jgi:WhiB family redox-sensing transcriptional regulator